MKGLAKPDISPFWPKSFDKHMRTLWLKNCIFSDFLQMTPFNELKSEIFLYYTVELLKSLISFTGC